MTVPAHPAGHPVHPPGHRPRPAARRLDRSTSGWSRSSSPPRRCWASHAARVPALRHRRRAHPRQRRPSRPSASALGIWLFGFFRRRRPAGARRAADRPRVPRALHAARSTSGGSTTSTTCSSCASAARSRTALWWFDVRVIDGTVNGIGAATQGAGRRHPPHPDRPRPELRAGHRRRPARHRRQLHLRGTR